jgi:hypothetical protein
MSTPPAKAQPTARFLAPEFIRGPAAEQRAEHRAVKRRPHRQPVHPRAEVPERLDFLFGARNDDGVETKQKAGERRGDGPKDNTRFHGLWFCSWLLSFIPAESSPERMRPAGRQTGRRGYWMRPLRFQGGAATPDKMCKQGH